MDKISRKCYTDLVNEDLKYLDDHCDKNSLEIRHIKAILLQSIDMYYPVHVQEEVKKKLFSA